MKWTDQLFAFMGEFDPGFRHRVRGASRTDIGRIEKMLGAPLPQDWREYLEAMGQDGGGLFDSARARTDVAAVLDLIECVCEERPGADFTNFVPFASCDTVEGWALVRKEGEWQVAVIDHNLPGEYVARSLPHLAFYTAFGNRIQGAEHLLRFKVRDSRVQLADVAGRMPALGFTPEWFCDHLSYFAVKPGILLQVHSGITRGFDGFVASSDLEAARREAARVAEALGGEVTSERSARRTLGK